jgi:hypothetical protein
MIIFRAAGRSKPYGTGLAACSTIVVQTPAANLTETYTRDTVPS